MRRTSVSRRLFWSVGATTVAVAIAAAGVAFMLFTRELEARQKDSLTQFVAERAAAEARQFAEVTSLHAAAEQRLRRRLAVLRGQSDTVVGRRFDSLFPLAADGSRRSRDVLFDGWVDPVVGQVHGVGAFLSSETPTPAAEQRLLIAAYEAVAEVGAMAFPRQESLYFYTPNNQTIVFAPARPDRLAFYRKTAPGNFSFADREMVTMTTRGPNPSRGLRCTRLENLLGTAQSARLGTACARPVDFDGRHAGAFGTTLFVGPMLTTIVERRLPGSDTLVVQADGDLVAYPGFHQPGDAAPATRAELERSLGLTDLMRRVADDPRSAGVSVSSDGRSLIAWGALKQPDWYVLIRYPRSEVVAAAARSAAPVLLIGLLAAALQALLVVRSARRQIVAPLRRLAKAAVSSASDPELLAAVVRRRDEIGLLARVIRRQRARVAEVLGSLECRVRERTAELEAANAAKSLFLANMSHELRTPLNGVIALAEMLEQRQQTDKDRETIALIVSSGRMLERVVGDILDFSKLGAGQVVFEVAPFDLADILERIAAVHRGAAHAKGLAMEVEVSPEAAGGWEGDATRIAQIVSNLLSNGVKFTEQGHVRLRADVDEAGRLRLVVSDTGVGFDQATGERLFRAFEQADSSITRRFGGTGLGLAISRALVEQMDGTIEADGHTETGSRFTVRLPLNRAGLVVADAPPAFEAVERDPGRPLRILLAEDHVTNQKVVELILGTAGHTLTIVSDGAQAVEAQAEEPYDLVLMDMQMPVMDGLTATRAIRATGDRTPIVMLTANALDEHVRAALEAGANRHLAKPIRPADLLAAVEEEAAAHRPGPVRFAS